MTRYLSVVSLRRLGSLLLLWPLLAPATLWAEVHEYQLNNGLKILVKVDRRAPVVVSQIWYKVGASSEHGGITGVSHVLEHMMFKGTKKHGPGEFSRIIAENGGRENAFTGRDYTAYFQQLEKSRLPVALELEADRMRHLTLPPKEFAKEVKVVMEERRLRTDDNPQSRTYEQLYATAFTNGPYHQPIIGWMNDLENLEVEDLRRWYQRWYAPNNATLIVAGDVDPKEVYQLAKRHFGPLKPSKIKALKPRVEREQKGLRRVEVRAPAELPYLLLGYKVPVINSAEKPWEPYALEVLAGVLSGGDSARLSRNLVRGEQIAASASAGYNATARYGELFVLDGTPMNGTSVQTLEKALRAEVALLRSKPVSQVELERIKAQVVASKVYGQDSIFYQAMQMGTLETVGLDWRLNDRYVDNIRAVTAEQVLEVAQRYLTESRLTVAELVPQSLEVKEVAHAH